MSNLKALRNQTKKYIKAYFISMTAATLVFVAGMILYVGMGNFEASTNFNIGTKIMHFMIGSVVVFSVAWLLGCLTALIPFFVFVVLAEIFHIRNSCFYILVGLIVGGILDFVFAGDLGLGFNQTIPEVGTMVRVLNAAPFYLAGSLVGGGILAGLMHNKKTPIYKSIEGEKL